MKIGITKSILLGAMLMICLLLSSGCGSTADIKIRKDYLVFMHKKGET